MVYQPDVGYVQGMSFIVAMLLINMNAYHAFVVLCNVLRRPIHRRFFQMELSDIRPYFATFAALLEEKLPKLHRLFRANKVESDLFLVDWFMSIFARSLPLDIASRIWDWYVVRGEVYLFQVGLSILKYFEPRLLRQNVDGILYDLTHLPSNLDEDKFFKIVDGMNVDTKRYTDLLESFQLAEASVQQQQQQQPKSKQ